MEQGYTYDKNSKKIVDPTGSPMTKRDIVNHLNSLYGAVSELHISWGVLSEGISIMDAVFLGALVSVPSEDSEQEVVETEDSTETGS